MRMCVRTCVGSRVRVSPEHISGVLESLSVILGVLSVPKRGGIAACCTHGRVTISDKSFTCDISARPPFGPLISRTASRYLEINIPAHSPDYKECAHDTECRKRRQ